MVGVRVPRMRAEATDGTGVIKESDPIKCAPRKLARSLFYVASVNGFRPIRQVDLLLVGGELVKQ